tara:strand:+ start:796 stop:984 length:189 start_codon:yes stop_codon:yes gene_type:complete
MKLDRYETNLRVRNNNIYSYDIKVAIIYDEHIEVLGYWSATTSKHINYCGEYYGKPILRKVK